MAAQAKTVRSASDEVDPTTLGTVALMERVKLAGAELEIHTRGQGRPLLFLHGEDYFEQHAPFLEALASRYRLIVPRHPGFGKSTLPADFRSIDDLAYLYLDLIDVLKLDRPIVVGASLGGWIALEVAVRAPATLDRLVLLGSVGVKLAGREDREFADIFQIPESEVRTRTFADPERFVPNYATMSDDALIGVARDRQSAVHFAWRPYMHNPVLRKWLSRVRMPTLVVWGDKDGVVAPAYAKSLIDALPDSSLRMIANAGHYPQIERPQDVVSAIEAFAKP
jgi:pimeloyl-ACP methyl ester carboxylesterase